MGSNGTQVPNGESPLEPSYHVHAPKHAKVEPPLQDSSYDVPVAEYPKASQAALPFSSGIEVKEISEGLIESLNNIFEQQDHSKLSSLMLSTSYWRDHLGFTDTKITTLYGADQVITFIQQNGNICNIEKFSLEHGKEPVIIDLDPKGTVKCLQAWIAFETTNGRGRGVMRLMQDVEDNDKWKIYTIFTMLYEYKDFPFMNGHSRPFHPVPEGMNWKEYRDETRDFVREDPAVLIVGAGHSGLMTAARLGMLGISALVIDINARTGDSWRLRYHDLVLHDPCWLNAMPYLSYPPSWPILCPKDKMADFLECYESALELNIWNSTQIVHSKWEDDKKEWSVILERRKNDIAETRTIRPKHIVQATGLNGEPRIPVFPGMDDFCGNILHSTQFDNASPKYAGKKVVVVGSGTSGHEVAHCLYRFGAQVTMVQRSPTYVMSLPAIHKIVDLRYNESTPAEDSDLITMSAPTTLFKRMGSDAASFFGEVDKPLLAELSNAGFLTLPGKPPALLPLTIHRAGGFYLDVGTSSLISSRKIKMKSGKRITHLNPQGVVFADGEEVEADEVIFCTGFENGRMRTRKIFGDSVADSIQPVWGYDAEGEIRGAWRRSGHPGFWVAAGPFWISRYYSRLLALQIKAVEEGIVGF